jgi:hypothetical protein
MLDENERNPLGLSWPELVGKSLLVGLTKQDPRGNVLERVQVHGRIASADPQRGLTLALEGARAGDTYALPPDLRSLKPAPPGEYRLRATSEIVRDPDYLATWVIEQPDA